MTITANANHFLSGDYPVVVISHKNCWDGTGAAWVADKYFKEIGKEVEIYYAQYKEAPVDITKIMGRDVIITDFSYPRDVLEGYNTAARSLLVLDHHATAKDDLEGLPYCVFDMERSGAKMAWDYFYPNESVPAAIAYTEDRDLWKWKLPHSKAISATRTALTPSIVEFDRFVDSMNEINILGTINYGETLLNFFERVYEEANSKSFYVPIAGTEILFVPSAIILTSESGNYSAQRSKSGIACVYSVKEDKATLSFRTVDGVDATPFAKRFGGGGHKAACGAVVDLEVLVALFKSVNPKFEVMP